MKRIASKITALILIVMMAVPCTAGAFGEADTGSDMQNQSCVTEVQEKQAAESATATEEDSDSESETAGEASEDEEQLPKAENMIYINPLYRDIVTESDIPDPVESAETGGGMMLMSEDEVEYCDSVDEAGIAIRDNLVDRDDVIKVAIGYSSKTECSANLSANYRAIMNKAFEHTGKPEEGDYLKWQYKGWQGSVCVSSRDGMYYATYTYMMAYFTTSEQEAQVRAKVNTLLANISRKGTDYEKAKYIYDYLCKNVKYDYAGAADSSNVLCHSAYAAAIKNKCVCQGYALLFYRMALQSGLDSRIVVGYNSAGGHAWNIVKVSGSYYYLDATWDAGASSYKYLLKGKSTFTGHSSYTIESFGRTYGINSSTYTYKPVATTISSLTRGKKSIGVKWKSKNGSVTGYQIRYSLKSSMAGSKTVTVSSASTTSKVIKSLKKKKKYYVQVRTYKKLEGTYFYSSWSAKKSIKTK